MGEVAETTDRVVWALELEEERLARIEHMKGFGFRAWLPELDFVDAGSRVRR